MRWKLVLLLSLFGVLIAVPVLLGWISSESLEFGLWLLIAIYCGWHFARGSKPFANAFVSGALMGIWQHLIVYVFWDMFAANNPQFVQQMSEHGQGFSPRNSMLFGLVLIAPAYGLFMGLFAWLLAKLLRPKPAASPAEPPAVEVHPPQ